MNTNELFHRVVEAHGLAVLRVCAYTLGPGADADDAWSETFVAALAVHPLPPATNVEAWLVRVARHKCLDILRAKRREMPRELGEPELFMADRAIEPDHFDDELWGAVAALSHRQQFVIAHRYIAQWTYPEIAEKLGCSTAAARRCGADAIVALRRQLGTPQAIAKERIVS